MSRNSKYIGGSKIATFRLPIEGFKSTRARLQDLLDQIANESKENSKTTLSPMVASAKTKSNKKEYKPIEYKCGCNYDGTLFRRSQSCRLQRSSHAGVQS